MTDPQALLARLNAEAARRAWLAGDLSGKLDATQKQIRAAREKAWRPRQALAPGAVVSVEERVGRADVPISFFELCARGNGKSFELLVLGIETALKIPNARVLYVAPLRDDAEKIAKDLIELFILTDCPAELKPQWRAGEGEFHFPNGSTIRFRGTNNDSVERLRGFGYHLILMDEVGVMDRLKYVIGIIRPLAERFRGKIILATTPAETPAHESTSVYEEHEGRGAAIMFTLLDNVRKTWDEKASILLNEGELPADVPGILAGTTRPKRTSTLREFFCCFVTEESSAVLPEFTPEAKQQIVRAAPLSFAGKRTRAPVIPWEPAAPRPDFFDKYVIMDPGFVDRLGLLFLYLDFVRGKIVIEADALIARASTVEVADTVEAIERDLWGEDKSAGHGRISRFSDIDLRLMADLRKDHALDFRAVEKQDSTFAMNKVRTTIQFRELEIHDRCVNLIRQMENALWNKSRTDLARDEGLGHFDLVACLKYACRMVDRTRNPFPANYMIQNRPQNMDIPLPKPASLGLLPDTNLGRKLASPTRRFGFGGYRR